MTHVVVIGAGLGGMPMAYEMKALLAKGDRVTVVGNGPTFHFVPSNLWLAVGWRRRGDHGQRHGLGGRARRRHAPRLRLPDRRDQPEVRVRPSRSTRSTS